MAVQHYDNEKGKKMQSAFLMRGGKGRRLDFAWQFNTMTMRMEKENSLTFLCKERDGGAWVSQDS